MLVGGSLPVASIISAATVAVGSSGHTLTYAQARASLRTVGVTKVFHFGSPSDSAGEIVTVTDGPIAASPLILRVFPSAKALRNFVAENPPPPAAALRLVDPHARGYLPTKFVCNVLVGSTILPWLNTDHPTAVERTQLRRVLLKIADAQARVVRYLQARCTP